MSTRIEMVRARPGGALARAPFRAEAWRYTWGDIHYARLKAFAHPDFLRLRRWAP